MHPDAWAAGTCWVGDHCQLDLWCMHRGQRIRPWLTAWYDWRSRKVTGWVLSDKPSGQTIMAALRRGLMDETNCGGPDVVYIDNGKDYDGYAFHGATKTQRRQRFLDAGYADDPAFTGLYGLLSIDVIHSLPYNAKAKRVERWFGYLHDEFDKTFDTYAGCSTAKRPENLKAILKAPHRVPTFEHVHDRLADFIAGSNASAEHSKDDLAGLSPADFYAQHVPRVRKLADPCVLDLLLQTWQRPVRVGRNGVTIFPLG